MLNNKEFRTPTSLPGPVDGIEFLRPRVIPVLEIHVNIFFSFREELDGDETLVFDAGKGVTLLQALRQLISEYPGLEGKILRESGRLRRFIQVKINKKNIEQLRGLKTELKNGDSLLILPKLGGG